MPTALVTGATAGIGAAFVRRLAAEGHDVVLVARDEVRLRAFADSLSVGSEVIAADLATEQGCAKVEERLRAGVDVLVNNAGLGVHGKLLQASAADELRMFDVNARAVLRLMLAALPAMAERGHGDIVNVSSVAGFTARGTYSATKAYVTTLSRSAQVDLASTGVRICAVCPGFTHTEFHDRAGMNMSRLPSWAWLSAERVVDEGLRDLRRGRSVSIPSKRYRAVVAMTQLIPMRLAAQVSSRAGRTFT
jgi:short-subunit dehydrogenase